MLSKNNIAIMQPYFFPYIGYYQLAYHVDSFIFLDDVNFINKGWINRNYIQINKKPYLFSIPLNKVSQNRHINEIQLSDYLGWEKEFIKTLNISYAHASHYSETMKLISSVLEKKPVSISSLAQKSITYVFDYLKIHSPRFSSSSLKYGDNTKKGEDRIISICKAESAEGYLNLPGGRTLYSDRNFEQYKIRLQFIQPDRIKLDTNHDVSRYSMIHLLMNFPPNEIVKMLSFCSIDK